MLGQIASPRSPTSRDLLLNRLLQMSAPFFPFKQIGIALIPHATFFPGQTDGRKRTCQKEEMENENDIVMKIKLQNIIWVNSSCVLKSAPAGSAHMALVLFFFLVQMSQRISAKGKTPAWGLFLYRLINHFPSFPFQSLPKLNLMKRLSFKICHLLHSEWKTFQERK